MTPDEFIARAKVPASNVILLAEHAERDEEVLAHIHALMRRDEISDEEREEIQGRLNIYIGEHMQKFGWSDYFPGSYNAAFSLIELKMRGKILHFRDAAAVDHLKGNKLVDMEGIGE